MPDGYRNDLAAALRDAIPPVTPPASLEARVLDAVAAADGPQPAVRRVRHWRARRPRLVPAGAALAAGAAAAVIAVMLVADGGAPGTLELRAAMRAEAGPAEAEVEVRKTGIGRVVTLESDTLPILPKGEYYELWFVGAGDSPGRPNRISAGTFHPDEDGRSSVRFVAAVDPALYPVLSVTSEPGDGDPSATGPEVLRANR